MELIEILKDAIRQYNFLPIFISMGVLLFCLILELFCLPFKQTSLFKYLHPNKSVLTDLVVGSFYLMGILSIAKAVLFLKYIDALPTNVNLNEKISSPFVKVVLYILLIDFLNYWIHRICHEVEFLWQIHKFHHSATDFVIVTGNRVHPAEKLFNRLVIFLPLNILGTPPETYIAILLLIEFFDTLQHSMVNWKLGWIGKNLIFSPVEHRIHHSKEEEHWDKNYGDIFVFWDKLFGTYYKGRYINSEVGVTDNWMNKHGILYDLYWSGYNSCREFISSIWSGDWKARHLRPPNGPPQKGTLQATSRSWSNEKANGTKIS